MTKRKNVLFTLGFIMLVVVSTGVYLLLSNNTYAFTLTSEPGSSIYVSELGVDSFVFVGQERAVYKTKSKNNLYVKILKGNKESRRVLLATNVNGKVINISLKKPQENSAVLLESPLSSFYEEDGVYYGINELTKQVENINPNGFALPKISFISVPYVEKIIWENSNNFQYKRASGGVGTVMNDKNKGTELVENQLSQLTESDTVIDINRANGKPFVYLTTKAIYTSTGMSGPFKKLANTTYSENYFFESDDMFIYHATSPTDSMLASEGVDADNTPSNDTGFVSKINIFDYSGKTVAALDLPGIIDIHDIAFAQNNNNWVVAANNKLIVIDSSGNIVSSVVSPFDNILAVHAVDSLLYVFSRDGLWDYSPSEDTFSSYYSVSPSVYIENTLLATGSLREILFTTMSSTADSGRLIEIKL